MKPTIACVAGARPNFVKIAPVLESLDRYDEIETVLVNTGQHYDRAMSDAFFEQLEIRRPDVDLEVGSGSHGAQTARILERFEGWLLGRRGDIEATVVVGDVNSTVACALASIKLGIPVVHVEAGLRSFDRSMPEEINRVLTDAISDLLLVSEPTGVVNLQAEGRPTAAIRLVGNVMIDVLRRLEDRARALAHWEALGLETGGYTLWTVHRPSNVDRADDLAPLVDALVRAAEAEPVVFPVHPRTRQRLEDEELWEQLHKSPGVVAVPPLGYLEFLSLETEALAIVTDSGGVQEEATALGVPCLTLRDNTERPITLEVGSNTLVGRDFRLLHRLLDDIRCGRYESGSCPELWDGKAGHRVAQEIVSFAQR